MTKRIISFVLCMIISLGLTGCNSPDEIKRYMDETFVHLIEGGDSIKETEEVLPDIAEADITTTENIVPEATEEAIPSEVSQQQAEEAAQLKAEWKQAYQNQINEMLETGYSDTVHMLLFDMDQDGIPEMLAATLDESDIYTYADGQLTALGYQYGYIPSHFYYQKGLLISTDYGYDVSSGLFLNITKKEGNQLINVTSYGFHWDESLNPEVIDYRKLNEEVMVNYETVIEELQNMGVYVTYEMYSDGGMSGLMYSVECYPGMKELEPDMDAAGIEERIRLW